MAESKTVQSGVKQAAVQGAAPVIIALRNADTGPRSATNATRTSALQGQRHGRTALRQLSFNWNAQDNCVEFEMDITNILQMKNMN